MNQLSRKSTNISAAARLDSSATSSEVSSSSVANSLISSAPVTTSPSFVLTTQDLSQAMGSKHSQGVGILFNPKLRVEIEQQIQSEDGRILILRVQVEDLKLVCANIYTPNHTKSYLLHMCKIFSSSFQERI